MLPPPRSRQVYLLPTRACVPLGAVLLAIAYAALSQRNAGAYLLGFVLASLAVVSMVHAHFALTGLRARVGRIPPTFAGQPVQVPVSLENGTGRTRRAVLQVARARAWRWPWQRRPHPRPDEEASTPPSSPARTDAPLPGGGTAELFLHVFTPRRGREPLGRLVISTTYPLGFFRSLFFEEETHGAELLVYPAPAGVRPLPDPPAVPPAPDPLAASTPFAVVAGDDYTGVRPYRPGDSQRHVDWRAAARGVNDGSGGGGDSALLVKQFAGAARAALILDWEDLNELGSDTEARLSQLCRWLLDAENVPDLPYGLRLSAGFFLPPGRGEMHLHRGLQALALFGSVDGSRGC